LLQWDDAAGKTRKLTIGVFGAFTVQQARDRAREEKQAVNDAKRDPAAKRRAAKVRAHAVAIAPTVAETAALFLDDSRRRKKAKRTIGEYERQLARDILPSLGHIKIADLAHRDIRKLHDGMSERPVTANRVFALLSAICNFAESHELRPSQSYPCGKVRKYEEQPNRRVLSDEEYVALGAALSTAEQVGLPVAPTFVKKDAKRGVSAARKAKATGRKRGSYRRHAERRLSPANPVGIAAIRFLALSGWRPDELFGEKGGAGALRWDDIDFTRAVATLPDTKTKRSVRPLGAAALDVLRSIPRAPDNPYVFQGRRPGLPLADCDRLWDSLTHAMGVDLPPYTLPHSFTTVARGLGYGDHVIARLVGHLVNDTMTSRYGDVPDVTVRRAANDIARGIADMLASESSRVLPFPSVSSSVSSSDDAASA